MLAFPLHMAMLTDPSFPFPAMGMVHLENTITQHRADRPRTSGTTSACAAANLRGHAKGKVFDMLTEVRSAARPVWEEVSTYLRRGKGDESAPAGLDIPLVDRRRRRLAAARRPRPQLRRGVRRPQPDPPLRR